LNTTTMGKNDDDYYNYDDDNTFTEYEVTSVDPGYELLAIAVGFSTLCLLVCFLCKSFWKKKTDLDESKRNTSAEKRSRSNGSGDSDGLSQALKPAERPSSSGDNGSVDNMDMLSSDSSLEQMSSSFINAIGIGLLDLNEVNNFDFMFVDRTPSTRTSRKWHNHKSRAGAGMSRQISVDSRSNQSAHSISTMGNNHVIPLDNEKRSSSAKSEQKSNGLEAAAASSSYHQLVDDENTNDTPSTALPADQVSFKSEFKHMFKLAGPWAFSSFVLSTASIINIGVISHYIGTAEMICYGYVWFFMEATHIVSSALYTSLYKHANNAKALGTQEGYDRAGKYIRISIIFNFIISVPITIILMFTVGPSMRLYGYGNKIAILSQKYTLIACLSNFISSSMGYASIIPDLEGHADFDAIYGLIDSGIDIIITLFLIPVLRPSLLGLGLIQIVQDVVSINVYYIITGYWNGWFDKYINGIFGPLDFKIHYRHILGPNQFEGRDRNLVQSLIKKTIPMTFDVFTGEAEWFVLTVFAAYLGPAEAATLVLISYIWSFVGIVPTNLASAFEYRISNLLSANNVVLAKRMASASMWMTTISSVLSCAILYLSSNFIVNGVTNDETLQDMLLEIIPYIVLCDPLIAPSTAVSYLNRALAMYKRSAKVELLMTIFVTVPAATISTYVMSYNIEGVTAAAYLGYATMGIVIFYVYYNADWDRAVVKNKKMSGDYDEEISITDTNSYEQER